jgi:IclR family transcriptional regulator, mhp operon transcriptional activator
MERDAGVRAIGRGLAVLRAINQNAPLDLTSIAKATGLPYPTVCRVVETLVDEGMIEREPCRKRYRPTSLVQTLSQGFRPEDQLVIAAEAPIHDVTREVLWPLTICSRVGSNMIIRASSHRISPKTLNHYYPGYSIPILGCSAGIAYLAFCGDGEREIVLDALEQGGEIGGSYGRRSIERTFAEVRKRGFAQTERCQNNANPGKTSSIAAPFFLQGECAGAVTLTVYSSVMTAAEAAEHYSATVSELAQRISRRLDEMSVRPGSHERTVDCAARTPQTFSDGPPRLRVSRTMHA